MLKDVKLAQKGILLVSIPLIFGIVFVAVLAVLLYQADDAARAEAKCRTIVADANGLSQAMFDVATTLVAYKYTKSGIFFKRYHEACTQVPEIFKDLRDLTKGNQAQEDHVKRLEHWYERIIYLTQNFSHPNESAGMLFAATPHEYRESMEVTYNSFMQEIHELVDEAKVIQNVNPQAADDSKNRVLIWLSVGVAFNVILTFILARMFGRTITERLKVLVDNNLRMKKRQPLRSLLDGNDEISELDRAFHDMAGALQEAEQRKQEYVLMVTHDLRTPLNSVGGCIEMLASGTCGEMSEYAEDTVLRAEQQLSRVLTMINEWLDVERLQSGVSPPESKNFAIHGLATQIVDGVKALADKNQIEMVVEETELNIFGAPDLISRVLTNLLGNALKFAPPDSTVTVAASPSGNGVRVEVRDQGRGVPDDLKDKIFERFAQVEKADATAHGGTGLGLAICKAIVESHHGKLGVESTEGQGSTFWFWLPAKS
jgi:signal transduction histidine kinase